MVYRCQVWDLHSLGRLFRAGVRGGECKRRNRVRGVVLEFADRRNEAQRQARPLRDDAAISPARVWRPIPVLRFRADVPGGVVRPGSMGRRLRAVGGKVCGADVETSRRLHALAKRRSQPGVGPAVEQRGHWSEARPGAGPERGGAAARPAHGDLLFALRMVQPAVAFGPQAVRCRAHVSPVQGCGESREAEHHLLGRRMGDAERRVAVAGTAGVAVERFAGKGRCRDRRPLGQGHAAQARRLLHYRIHVGHAAGRASVGGEPRHGVFVRVQPDGDSHRLPLGPGTADDADRHCEPRRQSAAGHRAHGGRADSGDHGGAAIQIGNWLRPNGEAIYGTRSWRHPRQFSAGAIPKFEEKEFMSDYDITKLVDTPPTGYARVDAFLTAKDDAVYAILPRRPGKEIAIDDVEAPAGVKVTLLETGQALQSTRDGKSLRVQVPDGLPFRQAYVLKLAGAR